MASGNCVAFVLAYLASLSCLANPLYTLTSIDANGGSGHINNQGDIALWIYDDHSQVEPAVFRQGQVVALPGLGGQATGINAEGDVVGSYAFQGAFWPKDGGELSVPAPVGSRLSGAVAANKSGTVAGYYRIKNHQTRCLTWTKTQGSRDMGFLRHYRDCQVAGINDSSQIAGTVSGNVPFSAFMFEAGKIRILPILPKSAYCAATAINNAGHILGYCHEAGSNAYYGHPVLWKGGKVIDLSPPGGYVDALPLDINNSGVIIGMLTTDANVQKRPALFDGAQWTMISDQVTNLGAWTLIDVTGINDNGVIAGTGANPDFTTNLLELIPSM